MSKKLSLVLAIMLVALLAATMIACNGVDGSDYVDKVPDTLGEPNVDIADETTSVGGGVASLKFVWTTQMSSVFSSISTDEFDIADVQYVIVFKKGAYTTESIPAPLSEAMVDAEDRALLKTAGHHNINVTVNYKQNELDPEDDGVEIKGSFPLHLRNPYQAPKIVELSFKLNGGKASFGETSDGVAKIRVEQGVSFTWTEFIRTFYISKEDQAISSFGYNSTTFSQDSENKIKITSNTTFDVNWTSNTIDVDFDFNHPQYQKVDGSYADAPVEDGKTCVEPDSQVVEIGKKIILPDANKFNVLDGFYFAGWYVKEGNTYTDKIWNFTKTVDNKPITLYAKWSTRYYISTIFTMGGTLPTDTRSSVHTDGETEITLENAQSLGYTIVQNTVTRNLTYNNITKITFSELVFGRDYSNYVSAIDLDGDSSSTDDVRVMTLRDIQNKLEKGYNLEPVGIYSNGAFNGEEIDFGGVVDKNAVGYIKWMLDYDSTNFDERISNYIVNYAFKDNYTVKADGSISLDDLKDEFVSELIIPAYVVIGGTQYPISELGKLSIQNARSLSKVDLSRAINLTTINEQAFEGCINLTQIAIPEVETVTTIGKDAFKNTAWQNNYVANNNGKEFIVVNKILYKYVGDGSLENVDFSQDYYSTANIQNLTTEQINSLNAQLKNVEEIAEGCFDLATNLVTVKLSKSVKKIDARAFANLTLLESVQVEDGSVLADINGDAFEGSTMFLSGKKGSGDSASLLPNNDNSGGANTIVIGSVLYRVLDDVERYEVQSNIKTIGANAFVLCPSLKDLVFVDVSNIVNVGADAFSATQWIKGAHGNVADGTYVHEGFAVINGILAEYYNTDFNFHNAEVPNTVKVISERAFNSYSRNIRTLQIGANVEEIEDYAFYGATYLNKFILSKVEAGARGLVGIPKINPNSFASSQGTLIENIEFYFTQEVMDYFAGGLVDETSIADADKDWFELYVRNQDSFNVETISGIWINPDVVPQKIVLTSMVSEIFADTYEDGLVLQSSAGLIKHETLSLVEHEVVSSNTNGKGKTLSFTYTGYEEVCHNQEDDEHVFKYDVIYAIKDYGNDKYYENDGTLHNATNLTPTNNFWIEGFGDERVVAYDSDGITQIPGFFTSQTVLDMNEIKFMYKDFTGAEHELAISQLTGYSSNANSIGTVYITIDFHGVGTFRLYLRYKGVESKWESMEQINAISIPLNSAPGTYLGNARVYLTGQDGSRRSVNIGGAFTLKAVDGVDVERGATLNSLPTTELGYHTFTVEYNSNAVDGGIVKELVYAVVLEADTSQFVFEIVGAGANKHAEIIQYNNNEAETIVIPNEYVSGGVAYPVAVIRANVFKNFTSLKSIYVPATITRIENGAFEGCTALENFYASSSIANEKTALDDSLFETISESVEQIGTVTITGLRTGLTSLEIVVPTDVTLTSRVTEGGVVSSVTTNATVKFAPDLFSQYTGDIYFVYNEYNVDYAKAYLKDKYPVFMVETIPTEIDGVEWVEFSEDNKLVVDSNRAQSSDTIYLFYTFDNDKSASNIDRFVVDESTLVVTQKIITRNRKLVKLPEDVDTIIVGDEYTTETEEGGIKITTINRTSAISDTIEKVAIGAVVYLPDTIFNTTVLKDSNGQVIVPTVYKAGSTQLFRTAKRAPRGLEYIGNGVFRGCTSLKTIDFSQATALEYLGASAFENSGLETLSLSATALTEIDAQTFSGCASLVEVVLPSSIAYIGDSAFYGCVSLKSVVNLALVKTIGAGAFSCCTALESVVLGINLTSVGMGAFSACSDTLEIKCAASSKPDGWADDWYGTTEKITWSYIGV